MVKNAARAETPFLRVFDACYGYLLKYNMPVSKGTAAQVNPSKSPAKPDPSSDHGAKTSDVHKTAPRPASPRREDPPSSRPPKRKGPARPRSRSPYQRGPPPDSEVPKDKSVRDARFAAWSVAHDEKGSWKGKCENYYVGLGTRVAIHEGKSRQELGNPCYLPCQARSCVKKNARHWARDCPNRREPNLRPRR